MTRETIISLPAFAAAIVLIVGALTSANCRAQTKGDVTVGAYYFDGWAGINKFASDPTQPWAKHAPTHLTRRMLEEFPHREPVWGWRDDSLAIMERQIDLAAENGIDFFLFCWYWRDNKGSINREAIESTSLHTSLNLYLKAKNKNKVKFALLVANHEGAEILETENWKEATQYWLQYFQDPQHIQVDGKPLIVLFDPKNVNENDLQAMQEVSKANGLSGLAIAGCNVNQEQAGFTHRTHYNVVPGYDAGSEAHPYKTLVTATQQQWFGSEAQPYIPQLTVSWDKRPWEGPTGLNQKEGWYYPDASPEQFKAFLEKAVEWMDEHPRETTKERLVLVYAWNELGEGGYLVPTKGDPGASYLKVVRSVVKDR